MTQDEIIEMAIEARLAFDSEEYPEIWQTYMNVGKQEIEAFAKLVAAKATAVEREALAQEQEPVAWMYQEYRDDDQFGWRDEILFTPPPNDPIYFRNITPVYTHPPQRTEQEPVATLFGSLPVYDTTPPQRTEQEPVGDEWIPCMKLPVVVYVRKQRLGETHVSTREGITPVKPDDLIMRGVSGEEYPIGRAIFERTYSLNTTPPQRTWVGLTDEEAREIQTNMVYGNHSFIKVIQAIEAKLKEKNSA